MVDYTERATCPIFGDGAAAFMVEPTTEDLGIMDAILRTDGKGLPFPPHESGRFGLSLLPISLLTIRCITFTKKVEQYLNMLFQTCLM